jgi:hypothetical protein
MLEKVSGLREAEALVARVDTYCMFWMIRLARDGLLL